MLQYLAAGSQLLGGLMGGGARDARAMRQLGEIQDAADLVVDVTIQDQQRALQMARDDEARLNAATGYDFKKLRDDAIAAGFNPLTALAATGGAGYDGRGAVVMSPFVSYAPAVQGRVDARLGALGTVVETAGYAGDAIANAGSAFVSTALSQAQMLADREIAKAMASAAAPLSGKTAGHPVAVASSPFDIGEGYTGDSLNSRSPLAFGELPSADPGGGYVTRDGSKVFVKIAEGGGTWVTKALADTKGWKPGQTVGTGDFDDDFNAFVGAAGAFDTALGGWLDDSAAMRWQLQEQATARLNAAKKSAIGFPEVWGVQPQAWDQGPMIFRFD